MTETIRLYRRLLDHSSTITVSMVRLGQSIDAGAEGSELLVILSAAESLCAEIRAAIGPIVPAGEVSHGVLEQWVQLGLLEDVDTRGRL